MNTDIIEGEWSVLKGKIKAKWGKLSDDEIETFKGNLEQIKGTIQKTYGYSKDQAEKDFADFNKGFSSHQNKIQ